MSERFRWRIWFAAPEAHAPAYASALEPFCETVSWSEQDDAADWLVDGYAAAEPDRRGLEIAVAETASALQVPSPPMRIKLVAVRDWSGGDDAFPPLTMGRFYIHGTHFTGPVPAAKIGLKLNAGTAFGSGRHASTEGCLRLLERQLRRARGAVLDLGCGSGILAIAAAKVAKRPVLAADIDSEAVRVATRNAWANGVGPLVRVCESRGYGAAAVRDGAPYGLIVANILARPLRAMAAAAARNLAPGGRVLLSGFLVRDGNLVLAAHRQAGLRLVRKTDIDGWRTLLMERRKSKP